VGEAALRADELVQQVRERADRMALSPTVHQPLARVLKPWRLQDHEGLDYAHHHWTLPDTYVEARRGLRARVRRVVGRLVFVVLGKYLREERELMGHLLRLNDAMAKRCDELGDAHRGLLEQLDGRFSEIAVSQQKLATMFNRGTERPVDVSGA
jgi:hypothetical protein